MARKKRPQGPIICDEVASAEQKPSRDAPFARLLPGATEMGQAVALRNHLRWSSLDIPESEFASTLAVLAEASRLVAQGWTPRHAWVDEEGGPCLNGKSAVAYSMTGAIAAAGGGSILSEYARRAVKAALFTHFLVTWEEHPLRTKRQVLAALAKAMRLVGAAPARRGGWVCNWYSKAVAA